MKFPLYIKVMLSVAILGAAAGVASLATFASFTSSTSAQAQSLTSGTVSITLGAANRLTVGASNLVPGDTIQRAVDINNNGSAGTSSVGSIILTTTAPTTSLLDSDATNGFQMVIDKCSVAWREVRPSVYLHARRDHNLVLSSRAVSADIALNRTHAHWGERPTPPADADAPGGIREHVPESEPDA